MYSGIWAEGNADCVVYLYSNQPVVRVGEQYYVRQKNFVDFLAVLATQDSRFRLIAPCGDASEEQVRDWNPIELPRKIVRVHYYESHVGALASSFRNSWSVRTLVMHDLSKGRRVLVAGPGPNSFLFWLSMLLPKSVKYAYFIRGHTLKTVQHIFKGKITYPGAVMLVQLFQSRIRHLLNRRRAMAFAYGEELRALYPTDALLQVIAPLIDESMIRGNGRPAIANKGALKVLSVGRLSAEKNVMGLLDGVRRALNDGIAVKLRIVGYGQLEQRIRRYIVDYGLEDWCEYVGYLAHGSALIREYDFNDVLCLPSKTEGVPRVVVEAFARGMPVLSTRVGSIPRLFPDEVRFIEGTDARAIDEALRWASTNRAELSALGIAGQQKAKTFGIAANADIVKRALVAFGCEHSMGA